MKISIWKPNIISTCRNDGSHCQCYWYTDLCVHWNCERETNFCVKTLSFHVSTDYFIFWVMHEQRHFEVRKMLFARSYTRFSQHTHSTYVCVSFRIEMLPTNTIHTRHMKIKSNQIICYASYSYANDKKFNLAVIVPFREVWYGMVWCGVVWCGV